MKMEEKVMFQVVTAGERLDKFLVSKLPDYSRSRLQELIHSGQVWVDRQLCTKAGTNLAEGQRVEIIIPPAESVELVPEKIALDVLYEDSHLIVINKPAGMVVHPAVGHHQGTLVHAILGQVTDLQGIGGELRPGLVHRLDKETSGIIVVAKEDRTHRWLQEQFRNRQVKKTYLALVDGQPPTPQGRIEAPIGRDPVQRKKMAVFSPDKGREAVTEYTTVERFTKHTLLFAYPLTGRTHQIRLHFRFLGCPVVGDTVYGLRRKSIELDRHFLHAAKLEITLPGKAHRQVFEAPLPDELSAVLASLRGNQPLT